MAMNMGPALDDDDDLNPKDSDWTQALRTQTWTLRIIDI